MHFCTAYFKKQMGGGRPRELKASLVEWSAHQCIKLIHSCLDSQRSRRESGRNWSHSYNTSSWCLRRDFMFTDGAAACFWCVLWSVPRGVQQGDVSVLLSQHGRMGQADHSPSEVAARKSSHGLLGARRRGPHRPSFSLGTFFDTIYQCRINPAAISSVCFNGEKPVRCQLQMFCL